MMNETFSRTLRAMIVDDDPATVALLTGAIRHYFDNQFEIIGTNSAAEARDWLDTYAFDFLITDIEMPGGNGIDLLRYAKACDPWTQAIMITGHSTWERITAALDAGASDYLLKPVRMDDIHRALTEGRNRLQRWMSAAQGTRELENHFTGGGESAPSINSPQPVTQPRRARQKMPTTGL